jgi:hypothetical protein
MDQLMRNMTRLPPWAAGQAWEADGGDSPAGLRCRAMRVYFDQQQQASSVQCMRASRLRMAGSTAEAQYGEHTHTGGMPMRGVSSPPCRTYARALAGSWPCVASREVALRRGVV